MNMNENFEQLQNKELISLDPTLVGQIQERKAEGGYGGILESLADLKDRLIETGFTETELQQVPAWHAVIGSTIPEATSSIKIERTISNARQEEIESRIRAFMEPFLPPPATGADDVSEAA